ncbi:MAG: aspartate-semialdehyde dehydrogenase, partial [Gemmatimonadales bacterium]|nr:aspartate-semialdehyde dehydrogenase [Gemmatimonadales bacterium]
MPHVPPTRIPVAVLGATGAVGQTFVQLLEHHPWFRLAAVAASERSAGKKYREATLWIGGDLPAGAADLPVLRCNPAAFDAAVVFSALDAGVAEEIETAFARAGRVVLSNARSLRMERVVPLGSPEMNADQLALRVAQRKARGGDGALV